MSKSEAKSQEMRQLEGKKAAPNSSAKAAEDVLKGEAQRL